MQAEERVEHTRHEFRSLLAGFPSAVAMQRHGILTYVNPAWTVLTGGAAVGQAAVGWVFDHDRDDAAFALEQATSEPVLVRLGYDPMRWVELEATSQMAFDGQQVGMVLVREVTDRRAAEGQRAVRDRLTTTRWIASGISHELNNPLTAVMANLDVVAARLQEKTRDPWVPEVLADALDAKKGAERMRLAIRDLKDLGLGPARDSDGLDLRRVVDHALGLMKRRLGSRVTVTRHFEDVPLVRGAGHGLGDVFVALLQNTAQAFARQEAQRDPDAGRPHHELEIWVRRRGRFVTVEVADDGPGVPADLEAGLFEPFVGSGAGLGLALVRQVVEGLDGTVSYDARGGTGALFRIELPIVEAFAASPEPTPPRTVDGGGRLLVIDDEQLVGRAVRRMLAPHHHEVVLAATGAEGLDRVGTDPDWDLVLLDLMMPGMSGVEVYDEIQRQRPEVLPHVVITTGGIYTEAADKFLKRTGCPTLHKPFDLGRLLSMIAEHQALRRR